MRYEVTDPWIGAALDDTAPSTPVGLPATTVWASCIVALHAVGYGGTPTHARRLQVQVLRVGRSATARSDRRARPSTSTTGGHHGIRQQRAQRGSGVRVRVPDYETPTDNLQVSLRRLLPIHLGHGGGGGPGGEIWVIRDDGGAYQANLDAIEADLTELGAVVDRSRLLPGHRYGLQRRGRPGGDLVQGRSWRPWRNAAGHDDVDGE